jgi:hypothetical protein
MTMTWPNHALQRTALSHRGCNRRVLWPPSLSLGRWADERPYDSKIRLTRGNS